MNTVLKGAIIPMYAIIIGVEVTITRLINFGTILAFRRTKNNASAMITATAVFVVVTNIAAIDRIHTSIMVIRCKIFRFFVKAKHSVNIISCAAAAYEAIENPETRLIPKAFQCLDVASAVVPILYSIPLHGTSPMK